MDADTVFAASAAGRRALADLLDTLDEGQLATPSLCGLWDVRTVAAHLCAAVTPSPVGFVLALLKSGGRPHRANDAYARTVAQRPFPELVQQLRQHAGSRFSPPVVGPRGPLTDVLVHTGDITVPLGLAYDPPAGHVRIALDFVTAGRPIGFVPRGRLAGLELVADDLGWSWGSGPRVSGRGVDLLMAACGRSALVPALTGPGVARWG
ncbi:MAG TPA: maleylpyruvate isomerase family mycothiol-dependent enzyme [Mycobacteriales bacterium]|jgi:uncharacterized protein (TIGR03083 family)|nr:maleylpyruvate isomerase family mycothiol-dependent enzyme [Mycobacteriales bacterium]